MFLIWLLTVSMDTNKPEAIIGTKIIIGRPILKQYYEDNCVLLKTKSKLTDELATSLASYNSNILVEKFSEVIEISTALTRIIETESETENHE